MLKNYQAWGGNIQILDDGFKIKVGKLKGAVCKTYKDHRITISLAVAILVAKGENVIKDCEFVSVSFSNSFSNLQYLCYY